MRTRVRRVPVNQTKVRLRGSPSKAAGVGHIPQRGQRGAAQRDSGRMRAPRSQNNLRPPDPFTCTETFHRNACEWRLGNPVTTRHRIGTSRVHSITVHRYSQHNKARCTSVGRRIEQPAQQPLRVHTGVHCPATAQRLESSGLSGSVALTLFWPACPIEMFVAICAMGNESWKAVDGLWM